MEFNCEINTKKRNEKWKGSISQIVKHDHYYEIWITSRSSIMVVFGATSRGGFACIPDFNIGCHLVNLKDKFWNTERLVSVLGTVDGVTVASALYTLAINNNIEF